MVVVLVVAVVVAVVVLVGSFGGVVGDQGLDEAGEEEDGGLAEEREGVGYCTMGAAGDPLFGEGAWPAGEVYAVGVSFQVGW